MNWRVLVAPIWVIGGLSICRWRDFRGAVEEIAIKILLAAFPIYITVFLLMFGKTPSYEFIPALLKNFENGELYLFCSSMLAAIFYFSWKDRSDRRSGPANLNNAISGNSGHNAGPRPVWQQGVFDEEEGIGSAHPPHPQSG
ncbi:MAG: hypothetical protein ACK59Y_02525, partial [Betaproteobacteria bacterium]